MIITQNEPIYIVDTVAILIDKLRGIHEVVGCVVLSPSPFGKRETFIEKALKIFKIFGLRFFAYYATKYIMSKLIKKHLGSILEEKNIPQINLEKSINDPSSLAEISKYEPDILLSIAGNEIFKKPLIELAPKGCLNLHTGLLPKYRGLMPTFWALKNKEKEVGVSVFYVDTGIDSGPIAVQRKVPVRNRVQSELIKETKKVGIECILEALNNIETNSVVMHDNDDSHSTYYGFPTHDDVQAFKKSGAKFF
ncbi:formyltransferase family protein [Planktomarina temperata]|nr:formyltransferase family protein [Planktomarina temperata]